MKKIVVLSGSIREDRKSHHVAKLIYDALGTIKGVEATLLDLNDYPFPLMEKRMDVLETFPNGLLEFSKMLSKSAGVLIVSPEYKNGIPGTLKNALDYLEPQILKHIPIGVVTVSSGGFGGLLCLAQLRTVGLALGGLPIPEKLCVSNVNSVFDASGKLVDESLRKKAKDFMQDFLWYVHRLS